MQNETEKKSLNKKAAALLLAAAILLGGVLGFSLWQKNKAEQEAPQVLTISTLEEIIRVSELSTFTAVYNGIAQVPNPDRPELIDYYASYEARVNAGIDVQKVSVSMDEEQKTIRVQLPAVSIMDVNVDIASLDFIFNNPKANTSGVTESAYKFCIEDVKEESGKQGAILRLARQNAENVILALTAPFVSQMDAEYTVEVV